MSREQLSGHTVYLLRAAVTRRGTEISPAGASQRPAERMAGIEWNIIKVDQATRQVTLLSRPNNAVRAMNLDTLLRLVREGVLQID